jgi:hypothetical protein
MVPNPLAHDFRRRDPARSDCGPWHARAVCVGSAIHPCAGRRLRARLQGHRGSSCVPVGCRSSPCSARNMRGACSPGTRPTARARPRLPESVGPCAWFSSDSGWVAICYGCKPHAPRLANGQNTQRPTLCGIVAIELGSALQATAQQPLALTKLRANRVPTALAIELGQQPFGRGERCGDYQRHCLPPQDAVAPPRLEPGHASSQGAIPTCPRPNRPAQTDRQRPDSLALPAGK